MGVLLRVAICYSVVALIRKYSAGKFTGLCFFGFFVAWSGLLMIWGDYRPFYNPSDTPDNWILHTHANVYDPASGRYGDYEGVLSSLGAIASTLLGMIAGEALLARKTGRLWFFGLACFVAGLMLAQYAAMPVIKKIWTPSFLLISAGLSFWFCALCHYLFDVKKLPPVA